MKHKPKTTTEYCYCKDCEKKYRLTNMNKSKCCNASVKDRLTIEGEADFEGKTNYYVCDECGKPCDITNN